MQNRLRVIGAAAALSAGLTLGACGKSHNDAATANGDVAPYSSPAAATPLPSDQAAVTPADTAATHHSKLKGALVGAVAGHFAGHHALAGAAAGALVQHERNKHP